MDLIDKCLRIALQLAFFFPFPFSGFMCVRRHADAPEEKTVESTDFFFFFSFFKPHGQLISMENVIFNTALKISVIIMLRGFDVCGFGCFVQNGNTSKMTL